MNILLMAPALFIILLLSVGLRATFQYILYCALLQVRSSFDHLFYRRVLLMDLVNLCNSISSVESYCVYSSFI